VMVIVPRETVTRGPGGTVRSGVSVGGGASADRGVSVVIPCLLRRWAPLRAVIHITRRGDVSHNFSLSGTVRTSVAVHKEFTGESGRASAAMEGCQPG
jgi:hypothetical protein